MKERSRPDADKPVEPEYQWGAVPQGTPPILWDYPARDYWAQTLVELQGVLILEESRACVRDVPTGVIRWEQECKALPDQLSCDAGGLFLAHGALLTHHDPATGQARWRQRPGGQITALAVDSETVYAATRGPLFALARKDGRQLWRSPSSWEPELVPLREAGLLLVNDSETETILAHETGTGKIAWRYSAEGQPVVTGPLTAGTVPVSGHAEGIAGIDALTGEVRWVYATGEAFEAPAVSFGSRIYASDGALHALDPATGALEWTWSLEAEDDKLFSLRALDSTLYAETWRGRLLALSPADGAVLWDGNLGQVHGLTGNERQLFLRAHAPEADSRWCVAALCRATAALAWELRAPRLIQDITVVGDALVVEMRKQILAIGIGAST